MEKKNCVLTKIELGKDELAEASAAILELLKELINQEGVSVLLASQKGLPRVLCRKMQTRINTFRDFHIEVCEK